MHVPLRRRQVLVSRQVLYRPRRSTPHREMRAERMSQAMYPARRELGAPRGSFHMMLENVGTER
jgi:hypothetical protein